MDMWEDLTRDAWATVQVHRMPVPGGWLYRTEHWKNEREAQTFLSMSTEFVPDRSRAPFGGADAAEASPAAGVRVDAVALAMDLGALQDAALRAREVAKASDDSLGLAWHEGALNALDGALAALRKAVG